MGGVKEIGKEKMKDRKIKKGRGKVMGGGKGRKRRRTG